MISAVNTFAVGLIASISKAVTVARIAGRKAPVVVEASVTVFSLDSFVTITLTGLEIAEAVLRSVWITVTRFRIK